MGLGGPLGVDVIVGAGGYRVLERVVQLLRDARLVRVRATAGRGEGPGGLGLGRLVHLQRNV